MYIKHAVCFFQHGTPQHQNILTLFYFIPKLAKLSKNQADARSLMTGRITDAYTNINTVKLFSHAGRESKYARNTQWQPIITTLQDIE